MLLDGLIATPEESSTLPGLEAVAADLVQLIDQQKAAESSCVNAAAQFEVLSEQKLCLNDELTRCQQEELQVLDQRIRLDEHEALLRTRLLAVPIEKVDGEVRHFVRACVVVVYRGADIGSLLRSM